MTLPLRLAGDTITEIIDQECDDLLDTIMERINQVFPDDTFPGTQTLPPSQRLQQYLLNTPAVQDLPLLAMPNYVELYKQGLVPPPQSPYWLNALSIPDEFEKLRADFESLARRTQR